MPAATITQRDVQQPAPQAESVPTRAHWYCNRDTGNVYFAACGDDQPASDENVSLINVATGAMLKWRGGFGKGGADAFQELDVNIDYTALTQ